MFSLRSLYVDGTISGQPGTAYQVPLHACVFQGQIKEHVSLLFQGSKYYLFSGLWPSLVSIRLFRERNTYLCIDFLEKGLAVVYWRSENSDVHFRKSSYQSKPVSNLFTFNWLGREGVHKV